MSGRDEIEVCPVRLRHHLHKTRIGPGPAGGYATGIQVPAPASPRVPDRPLGRLAARGLKAFQRVSAAADLTHLTPLQPGDQLADVVPLVLGNIDQ